MSVFQHLRSWIPQNLAPITESHARSRYLGRDLGCGVTFFPKGSKISRGNLIVGRRRNTLEEDDEQESEDDVRVGASK